MFIYPIDLQQELFVESQYTEESLAQKPESLV